MSEALKPIRRKYIYITNRADPARLFKGGKKLPK